MPRLILFNKPFGVLSQFTDAGARETLANFVRVAQVYPAGRLDRDSEGLLLLTDDGRLQARIAAPRHKMPKTYLVQVEGVPADEDLERRRPASTSRTAAPNRPECRAFRRRTSGSGTRPSGSARLFRTAGCRSRSPRVGIARSGG